MTENTLPVPAQPGEMQARVDLRIGNAVSLQAIARATPDRLMSVGVLVSLILLSTAVLVRAAKRPGR
jgi:hypothetical protein